MSPEQDRLVIEHMDDARIFSRRWMDLGVPRDDLESEAYLALCIAAKQFDATAHPRTPFGWYARWFIRGRLGRLVTQATAAVTYPDRVAARARKVAQCRNRLASAENPRPSAAQIAATTGLPLLQVTAVEHVPRLVQVAPGCTDPKTVRHAGQDHAEAEFWESLGSLPRGEQALLTMRYGLDGNPGRNCAELARRRRKSLATIAAVLQQARAHLARELRARGWHVCGQQSPAAQTA